MGTGGCHTQPSSFSPAQGRHLWESLSTPFCPSDRKIPKTPGCWIVSFHMMAGQQPNRMAYRDLSKGAVAWKGWDPYYSDTTLYSVLCLPMPLPASHCREGLLFWYLQRIMMIPEASGCQQEAGVLAVVSESLRWRESLSQTRQEQRYLGKNVLNLLPI